MKIARTSRHWALSDQGQGRGVTLKFYHNTDILNHNFLTYAKAEIWALTVCIVVNGEKFQSHAMTLTLIGQCPMSNSSELFSYTTICSSFKSIEPLFFELSCTQTDRQTDRQTDTQTDRHTEGDEYSIVAVDKPQL